MAMLSKGANAPLVTGPVQVAVAGARQGSVDLMVFQLAGTRKVRSDADFVFFNQPTSPEGAVRLVAADRITADLAAVPPEIDTLAVAVALDDAVPGSLAGIAGLGVSVTGGEAHQAAASGLTTERAAVLVEIYRRAGAWKVRNVSAGWAAGLSALAAEHGVSIDDPPPAPAEALPSPILQQPALLQPAQVQPAAPDSISPPVPLIGGYPPPGGALLPPAPFVPPQIGGWPPPGGPVAARQR